ncbi:GlsB/YeaQ/YmgE family stress response membrane protein [Allorhizocola rhizosphaerae]|uniref:GlsB/YeaQ/YmgE family stress response membrane protein n=1 Tax=Allorhizocola rhizosphaerae TaxID=1872709 RepID=UPI001B8B6C8A|nr:GlsB/YeaQ/YmgE family stress response membrane protein [Allorhizocola rhizosphaerae]
MTINGIVSALLVGILVGTLGRLILPGRQSIGAIATVAVGIGSALLGTWVARYFGVEDKAPASFNWEAAGWHFTWSWAEFGVQVLVAVVGIAIAAALTNTMISDEGRERARERRMRNKT